MKNKKGFTLIELIAVLVVLSILISSSVAVFINIRNSVLKKEKNNLITYLETKAIEYANETNVTAVSVEDLIKIGLIKPDDETDIYDPVTRESMNCYIIDLVWEDGEYKAKFGSNVGKNGTTCNEYTRRKNLVICQVVGNNCNDIKNEQWFKDDITIGLKFVNGKRIIKESGYEISWKSNTGISSIEDTIKTNVDLIANINYTAKVIKDNEVSEASQIVNIDKEAPIINEIKYNTHWSKSKEIEIIASDGLGSGVGGYAIVLENEKCSGYNTNNKITIKSNGNYKVCIRDKAGNETEKVIKVSTIDVKPENPIISASDGIASGNFHSKDYILSWKSTYNGTQDLVYYYGTDKTKMINKGTSVGAKKEQYNVIMYVKACTKESNLCSGISSYKINVDTIPTNPVISASDGQVSGSYHDKDYTLSWKSTNQGSQNLIYYYGTDKTKMINKGTSVGVKKEQYNVIMYVKACTKESNLCSGISSYKINVDTKPTNPVISASDGIASGKYHSKNYTLTWKSTNKGSQKLTYYYGFDSSKLTSTGTSLNVDMSRYGIYVYVKACTVNNTCSGISKYLLNVDTEAPNIGLNIDSDYRNYFKLSAKLTDSKSGIVAYAVTGYETPQKWITVKNTKTLDISRSFTWKEFGTYYVFAKDAMGNISKKEQFVSIDRDYPNIVDHEVYYDCSSGKMFVGARILAAATNNIYYYTSTNKNTPSLNASGWSPGCSGLTKYNGYCSGSRISLNRYGDTYIWAKACNSYNECTITPIGHAVCNNRQNPKGITYDSDMGHCYNGWLTYDINTDKYMCMDRWSHAQNISDKNLEVTCAENAWARKYVPVPNTNYCCPEGYTLNTKFKMGNYYACEKNFGIPDCFGGAKLSANYGYCTS